MDAAARSFPCPSLGDRLIAADGGGFAAVIMAAAAWFAAAVLGVGHLKS